MEHVRIVKISTLSETTRIKKEALKFIDESMNGLDIGTQGMPIFDSTISMDLRNSKKGVVNLRGDARNLKWFNDGVFDYVFSSHCFEDMRPEEKPAVLKEWARVVQKGGYVLLYLPDEQAYRAYCKKAGTLNNAAHTDKNFSINTVRDIVKEHCFNILEEIYAIEKHEPYGFFLVYRKI